MTGFIPLQHSILLLYHHSIDRFFTFTQDLRELRCRRCALKKIESSLFRNIPKLLELDLGENYVSELLSMERFILFLNMTTFWV